MTEFLSCRPNLETADAEATITFLRDVLGFEVDVSMGSPVELALLHHGEVGLGVVRADPPGINTTTVCYIGVTDVDRLHATCAAAGARPTELTDQPWGLRDFVVETPGGHRLAFGERIGPSGH